MPACSVRLVFCTYPSVYSALVLERLLRATHIEVTGVVCSNRILSKNYSACYGSWRQFWRSGPLYALYLWWATSGYQGLYRWRKKPTFESLLRQSKRPVLYTADINQPAAHDFLQAQRPDYLLCAHFNQLIQPETLKMPAIGCLNIHPSLLPDYQGVDPAFYALLAAAADSGVSVHWQNEQFDQGGLIAQQATPIYQQDSLLSLNQRLFKQGAELAVACLHSGLSAEQGDPQQPGGRYDSWPNWWQSVRFGIKRRYGCWRA